MDGYEADAASLRRAFNRAAETFPGSVTAFLNSRGPTWECEARKLMAFWAQFYEAIRDDEAGLKLLAELRRLREQVEVA
jgi:hypothetical protein